MNVKKHELEALDVVLYVSSLRTAEFEAPGGPKQVKFEV